MVLDAVKARKSFTGFTLLYRTKHRHRVDYRQLLFTVNKMKNKLLFTAVVVLGAAGYFAWQGKPDAAEKNAARPARPVIAVATAQVESRPVARSLSLIGNLKSETPL